MKNYRILLLILGLTIFSCNKEIITPEGKKPNIINGPTVPTDTTIIGDTTMPEEFIQDSLILGHLWTLVDGRVYVENLEKGYKNVYDYFDGTTNVASMSLFDPSIVLMDKIEKNMTTWYFSDDKFTLNGQYVYDFEKKYNQFNELILKPYGLVGGTSRPTIVVDADNTHMKVTLRESYNSDKVYNYKYFSELIFKRVNVTPKIDTSFIGDYLYNGRWVYTNIDPSSPLSGTKWVILRYNNGLSGNIYPNDTLNFISSTEYKINGVAKPYTLSNVAGNNMKSLSLYGLTTLGGDYSGQVMSTFITDGVINNSEFKDLFNVNNRVTVWIKRCY